MRKIALPAVCLGAALYFAHHALDDAQGWRRSSQLTGDLRAAEEQLAAEQAKSTALQQRVDGLNGKSLDPDLLDEQARQSLGLAKPDEIIIYKP